jgi:hypothetical protein
MVEMAAEHVCGHARWAYPTKARRQTAAFLPLLESSSGGGQTQYPAGYGALLVVGQSLIIEEVGVNGRLHPANL